ncbi:anion permease [Texcoconibacillus texcoconensis]|uniref:DASS family divalent anion:Na+ symporter n=1 Tax=Texcoconibacillus texcoconensis TaxID=1095777 RepID=A0A840QM21_9BACI|nr:anion permease [Texcoconibacillus texcoconensis]MBB5172414.1 DASS family divalent anion:Na+ symporter [Texcoconibacillus texcoconensis]
MSNKKNDSTTPENQQNDNTQIRNLIITFAVGLILWFIPTPAGLESEAWQLFAIFVATIIGFILKPLPMGAIAIIAITMTAITNTLSIEESLSGFGNTTIWLIVSAFFIARGFIKTGLGVRISYFFVKKFGKKTLGLSYALLVSDLILAPATPSNTARTGGILFPIIKSLCITYDSDPAKGTENKIGNFLMKTAFQGNLVTSAMFMTSMAANPLIVSIAYDVAGLELTWTTWAVAAIVPGLVSLAVIPFVIYKITNPVVKETPGASEWAGKKLSELGPIQKSEKYMMSVFFLILIMWIFGSDFDISATTTAFVGLSVLLITKVLTFEDIKSEKGAWDTLCWFAALVMMASYLNELGMVGWFTEIMEGSVAGMNWITAVLVMAIAYYYSHYFFASMTAHISAMYGAFLAVMMTVGAPGYLSALILAFFSSLMASTTHYGTGPAPIYYGSGYLSQNKWWGIGFVISLVHIIIWVVIGGLWWKFLGYW